MHTQLPKQAMPFVQQAAVMKVHYMTQRCANYRRCVLFLVTSNMTSFTFRLSVW